MSAQSATAVAREISSASNLLNPLADYFREAELAAELGTSVRSLRRWHDERVGPARTKVGRKILYSRAGVEAWLESRTQAPCRTRRARGQAA
jgi:hypothetical protein